MPPKARLEREESEQSAKRARKSVERLSSSKLQAKQYSPLALAGLDKGARPHDAQQAEDATMPAAVPSIETLLCHCCKRADDEDQMLLCDICDKGWHMFCLPSRLSAIPEGDWRCPDCDSETGAHAGPPSAALQAGAAAEVTGVAEDTGSSSKNKAPPAAKGAGAVETVPGGSAASHSSSPSNARTHSGKSVAGVSESPTLPAVPAVGAKWCRPVKEEGSGGAWMVGRRVQVWCEKLNAWREGRVKCIDFIDPRIHTVLFELAADSQPERVTLGKVTWKLDRSEDCGENPKTGRLIEESAQPSAQSSPSAASGVPVKRKRGRPRKHPLPSQATAHLSTHGVTTSASAAPAASAGVVPVPARAVDPNACIAPLRKKAEMLHEALEDLPVYVAVGGARAKKGRREGTLEYSAAQQRLMVKSGGYVQSLESFVEAQLGSKERPREHVFLSENDMPLVEHETTLSGYGREKLKDGTRVRLMFDNDDWYSGEVKGYDPNTARYHLVFEDGEEADCRHALFEPDDGFFLDNGKDCGMTFRNRVSTSFKAAQAAEEDVDKDRWRAPGAGEEAGGHWLVGRRIRVFWQFDGKFHEAVVDKYNPDPRAVDSRDFVGPVHLVRYDESKHLQAFPENLSKCVWNLDKSEDGKKKTMGAGSRRGPMSASNGQADKAPDALRATASSADENGALAPIDEGKSAWTAPHWKFKTGGSWLVGRSIKLYWDAERQWFAGRVLSYDGSPNAADSHGNIGPVHEVLYEDGVFFENLTNARWKLDANEGPSGSPLDQEEQDKGRGEDRKGSFRQAVDKEPVMGSSAKEKSGQKSERQDSSAKEKSGQKSERQDGKRRSSKPDSDGSKDTEDLAGISKGKNVESQAENDQKGSDNQHHSTAVKPDGHMPKACSEDDASTKRSRHGAKIVVDLSGATDAVHDEHAGDGKRNRESAAAPQQSKRAKTVPTEKGHESAGPTEDVSIADAQAKDEQGGGDELDLIRLKMEGRRWTNPDEAHSQGGQWLLDRCVRLFWDNEAQWFPGIVVDFDDSEDAVDSHGHKGPVHVIAYEDGQFLENLATATWQFDAKEGLAGVMLKTDGNPNRARVRARLVSRESKRTTLSSASQPEVNAGSGMPSEGDAGEESVGKGWRSECNKLLGRLMRQEAAIPFLEPVDPVAMNIPDYLTIIKRPMDLGSVRAKLQQNRYAEPAQVLKDIVLCFDNAIEYNPATEPAHKLALAMHISFASLCNGSQLLRPVLRCLDLSRHDMTKPTAPASSPLKKSTVSVGINGASSPGKKSGASSPVKKLTGSAVLANGDSKSVGVKREGKSEEHAAAPERSVATQDEKSDGQTFQAAKRGGPRLAAANGAATGGVQQEADTGRVKIHTKGRQWTTPTGVFRHGGEWLVGRHIQVYWDGDETWFPGVVTHYDPDPTKKDSHDKCGPVHDVYYEDGDFLENLSTAKWQYDAKEGPAGQTYDLTDDTPATHKKAWSAPSGPTVHTNPRAACESCRQKRIRCVHMAAAAAAAGLSPPKTLKQKSVVASSANQQPGRPLSLPSVAAMPDSPVKMLPVPVQRPQQLRGVKQDLTRKELEYQVVYAPGKIDWTVGLNKDSNFRELLLAFIQSAFPDRSVLHPWMPDFKKHMWNWGYREKQMISQGPEEEKEDMEGVKSVSGVQLHEGTTMYRTTTEQGRHKWQSVSDTTGLKLHKMAANFLFTAIGVLSFHMGRDKHAKFLRHLGAYEEFERGWQAFEPGQAQMQGGQLAGQAQGPASAVHQDGAPWHGDMAPTQLDPAGLPLFELAPPQGGLPMFVELGQEEAPQETGENEDKQGQMGDGDETCGATRDVLETEPSSSTCSAAAKENGDDLESALYKRLQAGQALHVPGLNLDGSKEPARDDDESDAHASDNELVEGVDKMDEENPESAVSMQMGGDDGEDRMQVDTRDPTHTFQDGRERAVTTEIDSSKVPQSTSEAENPKTEAEEQEQEQEQDGMSADP